MPDQMTKILCAVFAGMLSIAQAFVVGAAVGAVVVASFFAVWSIS